MTISLVINSGGKSLRLNQVLKEEKNKSWLKVDGKFIIHQNIIKFADHVDEIIVIVRNIKMKEFFESRLNDLDLNQSVKEKLHVSCEIKERSSSGPINGIFSAINFSKCDTIFFAPNDHPYLDIEDYVEMMKYLQKDTLVSVYNSKKNLFDPNLFIANKITMNKYRSYINRRITDLYRAIPNIYFIEKLNNLQSLYGINTLNELQGINQKESSKSQSFTWNKGSVSRINRDPIKIEFPVKNLSNLFNHKHYFILYQSFQKIKSKELLQLVKNSLIKEKELWNNISPLISNHINNDIAQLDEL